MVPRNWCILPKTPHLTALRFKSIAQERRLIRIAEKNIKKKIPAAQIIHKALVKHKKRVAVLWSGGRCSTVVLHMALKFDPDIPVIFVNTGVEFPQTVRYIKKLSELWHLNLSMLKPTRSFWEIIREKGMPRARKPWSMRNGEPDTPPCCYWLKKKPVKDFVKDQKIEALITGIRAAESTVRAIVLNQKSSQFYFVKGEGIWKYHPIAFWDTKKVTAYVLKFGIPLNPLYKTFDRVGCWPCSGFSGWSEALLKLNPSLLYLLLVMVGRTDLFGCPEGKPMIHLNFHQPFLGKKLVEFLLKYNIEAETHEGGKIICIPTNIPPNTLEKIMSDPKWRKIFP